MPDQNLVSLFTVLDGFIQCAGGFGAEAVPVVTQALRDLDEIDAYAIVAGRPVSDAEARHIRDTGLTWLDRVQNGDGEWGLYRDQARQALDDLEDGPGIDSPT